jgi:FixJ family two-component response regulator
VTEIEFKKNHHNIIIIDDDRDFSQGLADLLTLEGFCVEVCNNASSSIETLSRFSASVALIDLHLGQSSGMDLINSLQTQHPHILTIMMTAHAELETAINALRQGAYDYLRKPFHTDDLLSTLRRCFEHIETKEKAEHLLIETREYAKEMEDINVQLKREINQRIELEEELLSLNSTLDNKVRERTSELNELNEKIGTIARQAGMAEVASGMLHNIGNVLNSVNISVALIHEQLRNTKSKKLKPVVELLMHHQADLAEYITSDEKGKQIPLFLSALSNEMNCEDKKLHAELNDLSSNIQNIKNIINMQHSYTGNYGVMERVQLPELIDDALRINSQGMIKHNIEVIKNFTNLPSLYIDKHKYLQIIINLLSNAKYALIESNITDKKLFINISANKKLLRIEVKDNGIGISKNEIDKLFTFGYTKREGGHGFGLHNSALVANTIKGKINVSSDGLGKGASFIFTSSLSQTK